MPAPSSRTLQQNITKSDFNVSAAIQVPVLFIIFMIICCIHDIVLQQKTLDDAHRLFPKARWWIKADGVDLLCSLEESVRGDWNGDIDLDDGKLQLLRSEYTARIEDVPMMSEPLTSKRVEHVIHLVESDVEHVHQCRLILYTLSFYTLH